eukprot:2962781-Pyramimonas_sp.AAC.1
MRPFPEGLSVELRTGPRNVCGVCQSGRAAACGPPPAGPEASRAITRPPVGTGNLWGARSQEGWPPRLEWRAAA